MHVSDDDEFSLENISLSLSNEKYELTLSGSSEEALELLKRNEYRNGFKIELNKLKENNLAKLIIYIPFFAKCNISLRTGMSH